MSNINDNTPTISNNVISVIDAVSKHDFVHVREISRLANISPTTASTILRELEQRGILTKKALGNNYFYSINNNQKARKLLAIAENYNFLKECSDNDFSIFAESLLKNIAELKSMVDTIIACRENSEISLLFITSLDAETIRSRIVGLKTEKISVLTRENFRNNKENETIKNILKKYAVIHGAENFIELLY